MTSLSSFLMDNPGISLETANLFSEDALAGYSWPDADRQTLLQGLRIRQRMLKVYPDSSIAATLEALGFHSAHHIAATDAKAFAQKATAALTVLDGVTDAAALSAKIYANAARIRRTSFELALARPRTMELAVAGSTTDTNKPDFQQGVPDYERLFGPMITCDCEDCQSIFGPAAYFTDLMRIVTSYVTPPAEQLFTLQYRRPDLWRLPLDCGTAEEEVAYIDIVNAILQQHIAANYTNGSDPLEQVAVAPYPFSAPFNQSYVAIREGLENLQTSLASLYQTLDTDAPAVASAILDLSPEQLSLVTGTSGFTTAQLYGFHDTGITDADLCAALSKQRVFLRQTGLQPDVLAQLVSQGVHGEDSGLLQPLFFLNGVLLTGQYLALRDADLVNRTPAALVVTDGATDSLLTDNILKQLAVFIRMKAQYNWAYEELDWLLRSAALSLNAATPATTVDDSLIEALGTAAAIQKAYGIPADELSAFWYDMKTYGGQIPGSAQQNLWDRVYNTPPLLADDGGETEPVYYRPVYTHGNPVFASTVITWKLTGQTTADLRLNSQLAGALQISGAELTALLAAIAPAAASVKLDVPFMSMMYRVARMARMLSVSVTDFTVMAGLLDIPMTTAWSLQQVNTIITTVEWWKQTGLTISQLSYLVGGQLPAGTIPLADAAAFDKALTDMLLSSRQARLDDNSFTSDALDALTSQAVFKQLVIANVLTPDGVVTNAVPLTPARIGAILYNGQVTGPALFKVSPQRKVIAFSSAHPGNVKFPFYPFADPTIQATNTFTISFWAQSNDISTNGWPMFVGNRDNWDVNNLPPDVVLCSMSEAPSPGAIRVEEGYNNKHYSGTVAGIFTAANQWAFISLVVDEGNWQLYCNGEEVGAGLPQNVPGIYQLPEAQEVAYYAGEDLNGYMANLSIWTTARTGEQLMQDMYTNFTGTEDGLLAYWPINEGSGSLIKNYSPGGAAYNGSFYNGSTVSTPAWVNVPNLPAGKEILSIWQILVNALTAQEALVIKTLAGAARMSAQQMAGICRFTAEVVNNAAAMGLDSSPARPYLANFLLVADPDSNPQRNTYLDTLKRHTALARWFRLNGNEMAAIVAMGNAFGTQNVSYGNPLLNIAQLQTITTYKYLLRYCNHSEGLLLYFILAALPHLSWTQQPPGILAALPGRMLNQYADTIKTWIGNAYGYLAAITGWNEDEITAITGQSYFSGVNFKTVAGLAKLAAVFAQEEKLGMNIGSLNLLKGLAADDLFKSTANWQDYLDAAAAINGALSSKGGSTAVEKVSAYLTGQTRNVFCDWLIWELQASIDGVNNYEELYEYLLIDVNMASSVKTSWLVAGMNSLQLYVNRCLNNMEPGAVNNIPARWWEWMSTYRVWQANREVYLYPENYVDPTLRSFQSPQFKQFINDVSKGQITDNNVKQSLVNYLEAVNEVASLELIDGYVARMQKGAPDLADDNDKQAVFMIGRSRTAPYSFYTRAAVAVTSKVAVEDGTPPSDATYMSFGPWEKINLQINAPYIATISAFGRQFICWIEQTEVQNTLSDDEPYTTVYGTIYYAYRDFSATWTAPAILQKDIIISVYGDGLPDMKYYEDYLVGAHMGNSVSHEQYEFYKTLSWNKPRLQFAPASTSIADSIVVMLGDIIGCDQAVTAPPPSPTYTNMPREQRIFQRQLYMAAQLAYQNKTEYFTIMQASALFSSLRQQEVSAGINTNSYLLLDGWLDALDRQAQLSFTASSSLIDPVPVKTSWWPGINNYNLVKGTTVKDVVSGVNGTTVGTVNFKTGVFPYRPKAGVPQFSTSSYFRFSWDAYKAASSFTLSCWVNVTSVSSNGDVMIRFPITSSNSIIRIQRCIVTNGYLYIWYYPYQSSSITNVAVAISLNTWYFLTITGNSSGIKVYFNGVDQGATHVSLSSSTSSYSYMEIGNFNGYAVDIHYWDVALTAAQVQMSYLVSAEVYLSGMEYNNTSLYRLGNSAGAFVFNTGNQSYLIFPDFATLTIAESIKSSYHDDSATLILSFRHAPLKEMTENFPMRFVRVNTDTLPDLITRLAGNGIDALYAPASQYLPEQDLDNYVQSPLVGLPPADTMNFNGAFGIYLWELFFYAPYFIAEQLRTGNKYPAADKWFRYIFDPASTQPPTLEKYYDFLFNKDSETGPVAVWPLNKATGNEFTDTKNGLPVSFTSLTEATAQQPPFSMFNRNIWTFGPSSTAVTNQHYTSLNTPEMTITAWVRLTGAPTSGMYNTIVNSQNGQNGYHLAFAYNSSEQNWTLQFIIQAQTNGGPAGWQNAHSYTLDTYNEWQFVAGRYDGGSLKVYINGKNVTQNAATVTNFIRNTSGTFRIGCGGSGTASEYYFNGQIADVAVFDYAVKGGDIERLYLNYLSVGPNSLYWKFHPFQRINAESLYHILNGDAWQESFLQPAEYYTASLQMAVYAYDPFDPDTIARLRINSWQKATFMRYVENLLNWGDSLFTQDTWETLSDAAMRYVTAASLLGRAPVKEVSEPPQSPVNYTDIETAYGAGNVPPFLIDMENMLAGAGPDATLEQQVQSIVDAYFCVPANKQLLQYWSLVADRLFKLRHGLTISGMPNNIPLYAPAIDPAALVAAAATGDLGNASSVSIPAVPAFRFSYMIAQAKSVASEVIRMGGELQAALERQDGEQLAQMQASYQEVIYNMTAGIRASQVNQLQYAGAALQASYNNALQVHNTYTGWMRRPVNFLEAVSLELGGVAVDLNAVSTGIHVLAGAAFLLPNIFGLADGGMDFGNATEAGSKVLQSLAHISGLTGQLAAQMGQYVRREQEWGLQATIAGNQVQEISAQITANNFALQAARQEVALNQVQLQQSQEVYRFLQTKFTNEALYSWLSGQLSGLYFQLFQLAWTLAQSAQTALQYEQNLDHTYLSNAAWNASYQGLLGGDALLLALQQMETAYINGKNRQLEIRKTWSMRQHNPQALLTLLATGSCYFDLSELSYALDFPGHYNRKIKSLSVTIPAVVGPYQEIHATLVQTGNTVMVRPSVAAFEYLTGMTLTAPDDSSLRINWNPNQEIVISTGINDAGVFQLNLNDEQYLPFEGTGAVSSWYLSIPQAANSFALQSISDVIITVDYTAADGGGTYASQITALPPLTDYKGYQYLSLRQLYSAAWFNFCNNTVVTGSGVASSLSFELVAAMYPANLSGVKLGTNAGQIGLYLSTATGTDADTLALQLNNGEDGVWPLPDYLLQNGAATGPVAVPGKGSPWVLQATDIPESLLTSGNTIDPARLLDIVLVVPFRGMLTWG